MLKLTWQMNLLVSQKYEVPYCGVTIRAPALPSVLENDTNSRTDGKAGARMTGITKLVKGYETYNMVGRI